MSAIGTQDVASYSADGFSRTFVTRRPTQWVISRADHRPCIARAGSERQLRDSRAVVIAPVPGLRMLIWRGKGGQEGERHTRR
jgi:hypothetical protein